MKVTVIGGGSTYTPELVSGFIERAGSFPMRKLVLMDIDEKRLEVVGSFARRMVKAAGSPFKVELTSDRRAAIADASYVLTQFRVGQMQARREDEYLGRRHGLIGQETTGIGGFAKALRTIPVILSVADDMCELAPDALLVNFTNPAGLITEALARHAPTIATVGVCNAPLTTLMRIRERLEAQLDEAIAPDRIQLDTLGLNHLSWHRGITLDGEDIWSTVLETTLSDLNQQDEPEFDPLVVESLEMIPNYYLEYFYHTARKLAEQAAGTPSRAEEVLEIETELLRQYAEPNRNEPPETLMQRGGAYYSTLATQLLNSHANDLGETHVVNVRHNGAVASWPADWVLELPCRINRSGIMPTDVEPLPPVCYGLISQVKSYEILTVQAAVEGDRQAAYQALLAHPLGPDADRVNIVFEDIVDTHKAYLPQF